MERLERLETEYWRDWRRERLETGDRRYWRQEMGDRRREKGNRRK